jgi:hypothetical protein
MDRSAGGAQAGVARASATKSAAALCVVVTEWLPRIYSDQPNTGRIAGVGKSLRGLILTAFGGGQLRETRATDDAGPPLQYIPQKAALVSGCGAERSC